MLLKVIDIRFPEIMFNKSYKGGVLGISFETAYEFYGHIELEPPFLNEITSFLYYCNYNCYFSIRDEGYRIEIDFDLA
jgi:hypothetical protein